MIHDGYIVVQNGWYYCLIVAKNSDGDKYSLVVKHEVSNPESMIIAMTSTISNWLAISQSFIININNQALSMIAVDHGWSLLFNS